MTSRLTDQNLELDALLSETASPESGALVVFGGTVRIENDGQPVTGMSYTAYAPLAEKALVDIERETLDKYDITQCRIQHRIGELAIGDLSVLVVVRAAHRAAAFDAARYAIDTLKQRVAIWKEEHYTGGASRYLDGIPLNAEERN